MIVCAKYNNFLWVFWFVAKNFGYYDPPLEKYKIKLKQVGKVYIPNLRSPQKYYDEISKLFLNLQSNVHKLKFGDFVIFYGLLRIYDILYTNNMETLLKPWCFIKLKVCKPTSKRTLEIGIFGKLVRDLLPIQLGHFWQISSTLCHRL